MNYILDIGKRYSFDLYGGGVLPNKVNNVRVVSVLSGTTAERLGYNVSAKHAQVFALLPVSATTSDFTSQMYYEVEYDSGEKDCYGEAWINQATIVLETRTSLLVEIDDIDPASISALREVLAANGFKIASMRQEDRVLI